MGAKMDRSHDQKEPNKPKWKRTVAAALGVAAAVIAWSLMQTHVALSIGEQLQHLFGRNASPNIAIGTPNAGPWPPPVIPCAQQGLSVIPGRFSGDLLEPVPVLTVVVWTANFGDGDVVINTISITHFYVFAGSHSVQVLNSLMDTERRVLAAHNLQEYQMALPLEAYMGAFNALPDATEFVASFDVDILGWRGNTRVEYSCRGMIVVGTVHRG